MSATTTFQMILAQLTILQLLSPSALLQIRCIFKMCVQPKSQTMCWICQIPRMPPDCLSLVNWASNLYKSSFHVCSMPSAQIGCTGLVATRGHATMHGYDSVMLQLLDASSGQHEAYALKGHGCLCCRSLPFPRMRAQDSTPFQDR